MTAPAFAKARRPALALAGFALGAAASMTAMADEPPLPPPRPPELAAPGKPGRRAAPVAEGRRGGGLPCETHRERRERRGRAGAGDPGRGLRDRGAGPAVVGHGRGRRCRELPDRPLLACEFAAVLADYIRLIVAPLGQAMLHARVAAIETGPGYECRTQDRIAGAKISAHGHGLAVDFVAIAFEDKRRVLVERQTGADEASYFRALRTAACGWFTTVLGPALMRSTPPTCISTSNAMTRAGAIAFASDHGGARPALSGFAKA